MKNKKGFEFSFAMLFSILAGAAIIALAIYAAINVASTFRLSAQSENSRFLGIILSPLEAQSSSARADTLKLDQKIRVYNECEDSGTFGSQNIGISYETSIGNKYEKPILAKFYNRYVFTDKTLDGKSFEIFSLPVNMPFKVADALFLIGDQKYCFVNPPSEVNEEISDLNLKKINLTTSINRCSNGSMKVCFGSNTQGCSFVVNTVLKTVQKGSTTLYYDDSNGNALLYGAIFMGAAEYGCQVKRVMHRTSELSFTYLQKAEILSGKGCSFANIEEDLINLGNKTAAFNEISKINEISVISNEIGRKNENLASCKLF